MMSIVFHHYKILKERSSSFNNYSNNNDDNINDHNSTILKQDLDRWNGFSSILRKQNRELFREMLQSSYKYFNSIDVKGENYSTESLLMSLMFEQQYKIK